MAVIGNQDGSRQVTAAPRQIFIAWNRASEVSWQIRRQNFTSPPYCHVAEHKHTLVTTIQIEELISFPVLFYFLSVRIFRKTTHRCGGAYKKHLASLFWFNEFNVIIPQWFSPFSPHWRRLEALEVIEVEESARQTVILSHSHQLLFVFTVSSRLNGWAW